MKNTKKLFDETSPVWIKIYKILVIILFCVIVLFGFLTLFNSKAGDFRVYIFFGCAMSAFLELVLNMLILNFLKNVQIIREEICYLNDKTNDNENVPFQDRQK